MANEYPHQGDPAAFTDWLYDRVSTIPDVTWDRFRLPVHTSYLDWNVWGTVTRSAATSTSGSSPNSPSLAVGRVPRTRSSLHQSSSREDSQKTIEKVQQRVIARLSTQSLRIERQYQIIKQLSEIDSLGNHHIRASQLLRLPAREGFEEPSLVVLILEDTDTINALRKYINYGPGFYFSSQLPSVCPHNPKLTSDGVSETGHVSLDVFLHFAKGAVQSCITIHDKSLIHGEIRPDALHFDDETGQVRWINHGAGLRAFENGLTGSAWTELAQSYGVGFKLQFLAPEQTGRLSASPDNRTDIYSLGIVFYILLTGEVPFVGTGALEILQNVLSRRVPSIARKRPDLPRAIVAVVAKMVSRNIEDRYHSAHGLLWDLVSISQLHNHCLTSGDTSDLEKFEPATRDAYCVFRLPEDQIGRDSERQSLLKALHMARDRQKLFHNRIAEHEGGLDNPSVNGVRSSSIEGVADSDSASDISRRASSVSGMVMDFRKIPGTTAGKSHFAADGLLEQELDGHEETPTGDNVVMARAMSVDGTASVHQIGQNGSYPDSGVHNYISHEPNRTTRYGKTDVVSIVGSTGIGKSRLVGSVLSDIRQQCYVSSSKFDGATTSPFQALTMVLSSLFRQILMRGSHKLVMDLKRFISPMWLTISKLMSLPPDLLQSGSSTSQSSSEEPEKDYSKGSPQYQVRAQLHDDSPSKPSRSGGCKATDFLRTGVTSKNSRFQALFVSILRFIARSESVVFVLEDLESADAESAELLLSIVRASVPMTLILTCRSLEDISPALKGAISHQAARATNITLQPFDEDGVTHMITQTLHRSEAYCAMLSAFALQKSSGNPFALRAFLEECHKKGYITFDWDRSQWKYDLEGILQHFEAPDVHVSNDFIVEQLLDFPGSSRQILAWACLLGTPFSFSTVKTLIRNRDRQSLGSTTKVDAAGADTKDTNLVRQSSQDIVSGLEVLLHASIVLPTESDDLFQLCHQRWRNAAKKLSECARKDQMHFAVAHLLLSQEDDSDAARFARATHICESAKIIKAQISERRRYRGVLVNAAARLTEAQSADSRLKYLSNAISLLQDSAWEDDATDCSYSETLLLHIQASEAYSRKYPSIAKQLIGETLEHTRHNFERVPSYILLSRIQVQSGNMVAAFSTISRALAEFDVRIDESSWEQCDERFNLMRSKLEGLSLRVLESQPLSDDTTLAAISELLSEGLMLAFWIDGRTFYNGSLMFLELMLERGITAHTTQALGNVGSCIIGRFDLVELGVRLGSIGEGLYDRFDDDDYATGKGLGYTVMQIGWLHRPLRTLIPDFDRAFERALAASDRNNALMNASFGVMTRVWASFDAAEVESYLSYVKEMMDWDEDVRGGIMLTSATQYVRAMQGKTLFRSPATVFNDAHFDLRLYMEWACSRSATPQRVRTAIAHHQLPCLYLFGHIEAAVDLAEQELLPAKETYWSMVSRTSASSTFYISLAYLASQPVDADDDQTRQRIEYAEQTLNRLQTWSKVNEVNILSWTKLLLALLLERKGQVSEAVANYETGLDHAEIHNQTFEYALVCEHYADFLIRRNASRLARNMIRDAQATYRSIQYLGKAEQLATKHEWLLMGTSSLQTSDAACQTDLTHGEDATKRPLSKDHEETSTRLDRDVAGSKERTGTELAHASNFRNSQLPAFGLDVVDVFNILQSSQILASTLNISELLAKMSDIMLTSSGADLAAIIVRRNNGLKDDWVVAAFSDAAGSDFPLGEPLENVEDYVAKQITLYGLSFREPVFVENIYDDERFADVGDTYREHHPDGKSVFTSPILHGEHLLGAIYVESPPRSFTQRGLTVLQSLLSSISISIANANLFEKLEKSDASNKALIESQRGAITQARQSEQKAQEAREEALESLRLKEEASKAKSLFLANTSHELRTPLNGVIGMSELLKNSELSEEQAGYADSIRVCADTLLQVINDLLDLSKIEAGKLQLYSIPLSLHETIQEVVRALSYSNRGKPVETVTDLRLDPQLTVNGDPVRLHQLLMNLLSNAYKFTARGTITVRCIIENETAKDVDVVISVADSGIGIDESAKRKLFMPFAQADSSTSRSYGGTGLGLSICKAIAETMGGTIWLESERGVGTTVSFRLKLAKIIKGKSSAENKPTANPMKIFTPDNEDANGRLLSPYSDLALLPKDKIRIAIAEDNKVNQKIAIRFVQKLGFPCEAYDDGQATVEALGQASSEGNHFSIILMDCQMPRLDGYDATRHIRNSEDPKVRDAIIIAMTASAIRGDREKCLEAGMSNYLAKPIRQEMLRQMLDHYVKPQAPSVPASPAPAPAPLANGE